MSTVLIIPVSQALRDTYERTVGAPYGQLIDAAVDGYISLWESRYARHDRLSEMRAAEQTDQPGNIKRYIEAFADTTVSREAYNEMGDTLQTGENRAMYVAFEGGKASGVLQISSLAYEKFEEKRPDALANLHRQVCSEIRCDPQFTSYAEAFAFVSKVQRNYANNTQTAAALLHTALTRGPHARSAGLFSVEYYDQHSLAAAEAMGFGSIAQTTTMDSETPCHFMFGRKVDVVEILKEQTEGLDYSAPILSASR